MKNLVQLLQAASAIQSPRFVSFTYTDKKHGETARRVLLVGESYLGLLESARLEVELTAESAIEFPLEVAIQAKREVLESLDKSIAAHKQGGQSADYTKRGLYETLAPGVKMFHDGTLELCGVEHSKVILQKGIYKPVKSAPLTLAKNAFRKLTRLGKFKTLCLDAGHAEQARINGETLELA